MLSPNQTANRAVGNEPVQETEVNQCSPDRVGWSPKSGSGSGSGSEGWISLDGQAVINDGSLPPNPCITLPHTPRSPYRQHRYSPSLGLLSPILGFTSLYTPTRPVTPSPLRVFQPSTPSTPSLVLTPATATPSLLFSTDDLHHNHPAPSTMPVHQPRPQHPSASSSASSSAASTSLLKPAVAPPSRPPSRSEKLLREALMRCDQQDSMRPPMPHSPYTAAAPSSSSRSPTRHRRRHSEIPTTAGSTSRTGRFDAEMQQAEEYARGANMFRSPVVSMSPRAPSPPALSRRHSQTQRGQQQQQQQQQQYQTAASQASHSPTRSPVLARRSSMKSDRSAATTGISRSRVPHPLPLHDPYLNAGEPPMTPHEQLLRARLERVLAGSCGGSSKSAAPSAGVCSPGKRSAFGDDWRREDSSPTADDERYFSTSYSPSSSGEGEENDDENDENVVRDENGRACDRRKESRTSTSTSPAATRRTTTTMGMMSPPTTSSGSSRSMSQERLGQRSRTEPILPAMLLQQLPSSPYHHTYHHSQRKSATAPSPAHRHYRSAHHHRSGTTPPLVSDGSPTPPEEDDYDDSLEEEDLKLLTPPATPPSYPAPYAGHHHPSHYTQYAPSPYFGKTFHGQQLQGHGRPPLRAPLHDDDDEQDADNSSDYFDEEDDGEYPTYHHHHQLPASPGPAERMRLQQQSFNVRRASAKAREMEGYVSFSAVEGLGAPPESSESSEDDAEGRGRKGVRKGMEGKGVGGWVRRLWGSETGQGQGVVM